MTVIVGINGAGKTSILDAITKMASWLPANILKEGGIGKRVVESDIYVNSQQYAEINALFHLTNKNTYSISLGKAVDGSANKKDSDVVQIKQLANIYRVVNAKSDINLPTFVYYTINRSKLDSSSKSEKDSSNNRKSKFEAYRGALDGGEVLIKFLDFFIQLDNQILEPRGLSAEGYAQFQEEASIAKKQMQLIQKAITQFVPEITDLFIDRRSGSPEVKVKIESVVLGISLLSDGQKSAIAMVADLARRLIMLNPHRENPLEGQGIVLIDEIELHLHPAWQQTILIRLQETFPNIQFIVTTHSPQVLSTIPNESIRLLGKNIEDKNIAEPPLGTTYGEPSGSVMHSVMGVNPVPPIKESQNIKRLSRLIHRGKYDSKEAKDLFKELENTLGKDHPQLRRLQLSLQNLRMMNE